MAVDRLLGDGDNTIVGPVAIEGAKGCTLPEGALVEGVVRGAPMDTAGCWLGDIPQGKGIDILQGDSRKGLGLGSCVGAGQGLGGCEQLTSVIPDTEQLGMDTIPQHLGSSPLGFTAGEHSRWRGPRNEGC